MNVQLSPMPRVGPQLLLWKKSVAFVPVREIADMVSIWLPTFVSVTVIGPTAFPTLTAPNRRAVGLKLATGAPPVPESGTLLGLPEKLVTKVKLAENAPAALGVNVIPTRQLFPAAREAPQVLEEMAKLVGLVPVREILVIVKVAVPVLDS